MQLKILLILITQKNLKNTPLKKKKLNKKNNKKISENSPLGYEPNVLKYTNLLKKEKTLGKKPNY